MQNPFQAPSTIDSDKPRKSWLYLFTALLWCGLAIKMIVVRPMLRNVFDEFEVRLPIITVWLLHPMVNLLVVTFAFGLLLAGPMVDAPERRRKIAIFALALAVAFAILIFLGFLLPLYSLMRALA